MSKPTRLLPPLPLADWITVWSECYDSERFRQSQYDSAMARLDSAKDDISLRAALKDAFLWKNNGKLNARAKRTIATIDVNAWTKWGASKNPPPIFSGVVWNVFLLHLASH